MSLTKMPLDVMLIAAIAENGVIGDDNRLIWRLKSDLKRFRALTMGTPMIMGRKTYESIGKPLPGRETIVVTRNTSFRADGVSVVHGVDEALALAQVLGARMKAAHVSVVGGSDIYAQMMPRCDGMMLTLVHANPEGDARFPAIAHQDFVEMSQMSHPAGPDDEFPFTFVDYRRRLAPIAR